MSANVLKAATANRLRDGDVVYLTARGRWSTVLNDSCASGDTTVQEKLLASAEQAVHDGLVVGPYLLALERVDGELQPLSQRERIRARRGPTFRYAHSANAVAAE